MKQLIISFILIILGVSFLYNPNADVIDSVTIDIKGAVNEPGVYEIEAGSTVNDAIILAGGLALNADTSYNNLALKVYDEMAIVIYTIAEVNNSSKNTVIKFMEQECSCPTLVNNDCLKEAKELINLNTATMEELMTLPGIGQSKAKDIIAYRLANGNFTKLESLMQVKGIGQATYDKLKSYITI